MRGMRSKGGSYSTQFGEVTASKELNHLGRLQNSPFDKKGTYFDQYDLRVTCESKAGDTDTNFSSLINALADAGINYREEKRYTVQPDRVVINVLVHRDDLDAVKQLNKDMEKQRMTFTVNDNVPEDIVPKQIVTPEEELDETIKEDM